MMVTRKVMLAIATAVAALSAFSFSAPLLRTASATSGLSPIPAASSCTYGGHPTSPITQTTVSIFTPGVAAGIVTKHAEKQLYDCIISGSTKHYILDTTTWTTIREVFIGGAPVTHDGIIPELVTNTFVECAKDKATGTLYSCQTEAVGNITSTSACTQLGLGFPQTMNTVVFNGFAGLRGFAETVESQKELFKCSTPNGSVIQEVIIWTITGDSPTTTGSESLYLVETCQKPVTITTGLPLLNCQVQGPNPLIA